LTGISQDVRELADWVETFGRELVVPCEKDARCDHHGAPTDELVHEMRANVRLAAIFHGIKGRVIRGTRRRVRARERSRILSQFIKLAWRQAGGRAGRLSSPKHNE
jgi:hypothetical protein